MFFTSRSSTALQAWRSLAETATSFLDKPRYDDYDDLILCYRIVFGIVSVNADDFFSIK